MQAGLLVALSLFAAAFVAVWLRQLRTAGSSRPSLAQLIVGFGTNFFDTLGIGSFAPTAAIYRLGGMVSDAQIPGTMNVGHTLPVVLMAFLFIGSVDVDPATLITLIGAAVVGAWFGAGLVSRLPRRPIQLAIGIALLVAAALMAAKQLEWAPAGGVAIGLNAGQLAFAAVVCVLLGALNTIGVGFYGPCMILVALLGMNPKTAFPIMMGSCAFLMSAGSARFVTRSAFHAPAALGLTLGGLPAVWIAAELVKELPLDLLGWLVVVVATYTAAVMLRAAAGRAAA